VQRIVVGFDGSAAALAWGADEARLHNVELQAMAVLDRPPPESVRDPVSLGGAEVLLGTLRRVVQTMAEGLPADLRCGHGGAAMELIGACTDDDLLVVGSRGRHPFAGLLLGSVSRTCLTHAPCPVAVVRSRPVPRPYGRVIVGVDASEQARLALCLAAEEARLRGAVLDAIHAVHRDHPGAESVPSPRQLLARGRQLVAAELHDTGVAARPVVGDGFAPDVLVRHSVRADLLVLGSRGRNSLASLLLGSTSDHCARHAACPVLIVR